MSAALILATGLARGVDWRLLALAGGSIWFPLPAAVAVGVVWVIGRQVLRREAAGAEVRFAETVLSELRSGSSLRRALRTACALRTDCANVVRLLDVGDPLATCVEGLADVLPGIGALVVDAVTVGAGGGTMTPVFEELVVLANNEEVTKSEISAATAQVRASMWILVGGPVAYLIVAFANGSLARLLRLPGSPMVALVGAVLFLGGTVIMALMVRSPGARSRQR